MVRIYAIVDKLRGFPSDMMMYLWLKYRQVQMNDSSFWFLPNRIMVLLALLLLWSSCFALTSAYGSDSQILLDEDIAIDYGGEFWEYAGDARILNSTFNSTYALLFVAAISAVLVVIGTFLFLTEESSHDFTKDRRRTRFHSNDYEYLYDDGRYLSKELVCKR